MTTTPEPTALEAAIRTGILRRTGGQLEHVIVKVHDGHIEIRGRARSFYVKQLAIQGLFDVIGQDHAAQVEANIQVMQREE